MNENCYHQINGGLTILVEIITIALASAFVAQITRRAKRYQVANNMETKLTEIQERN